MYEGANWVSILLDKNFGAAGLPNECLHTFRIENKMNSVNESSGVFEGAWPPNSLNALMKFFSWGYTGTH